MEETLNEGCVRALYAALNRRDAQANPEDSRRPTTSSGGSMRPPSHQFLMRFLTGENRTPPSDLFRTVSPPLGPRVLAEGFDQSRPPLPGSTPGPSRMG
ncbi:hypothetical protein PHJA_003024100 [Phtheirospermum japonicum]|uniref:Uncharacterized protein n=1 Tax=Phtheirospermum japonicum TaxID=374723 RepID=A0A830DA15_9LAMI|nr:hypothetical protein PHJA_003024100 [Phtheirospermum japonicum]